MKYLLTVRSRPRVDDPVPQKHERLRRQWSTMSPPWGLSADQWPDAPEPGVSPLTVVNLSKCLPKGMKGTLNYQNRKRLPDDAQADDWLRLEFDPERVGYAALVDSAFSEYVRALAAYVATVYDRTFDVVDFDRWRRAGMNGRHGVFRIYPLHFLDRKLCQKAFALAPEEVARRLAGKVERVSVESNGVLVVADSKPLAFEEAGKIDRKVRLSLTK